MLEATQHRTNAFVTLTYSDENLPQPPSVSARTLQLFHYRHRKRGYKYRYYSVGEYGSQTLRPHYHLALFGHPQCFRGQTDLTKQYCCETCEDVKKSWQNLGAIQVAFLEPASAAYIAGYVTKKLTAPPIPKFLAPEFQRVSLRPGLGLMAMHDVSSVLMEHDLENRLEDVPLSLQHGQVKMPLGRYLRQNLRKMIGRDEKCPPEVIDKAIEEMSDVREAAFNASTPFRLAIQQANQGKIANFLAKQKLKQAKGHL